MSAVGTCNDSMLPVASVHVMGLGLYGGCRSAVVLLTAEVHLCRSILSSLLHHYSWNVQWTVTRDRCRCSVDSEQGTFRSI